jgi:hypothetical protein
VSPLSHFLPVFISVQDIPSSKIVKTYDRKTWAGLIWLRIRIRTHRKGRSGDHENEAMKFRPAMLRDVTPCSVEENRDISPRHLLCP